MFSRCLYRQKNVFLESNNILGRYQLHMMVKEFPLQGFFFLAPMPVLLQ